MKTFLFGPGFARYVRQEQFADIQGVFRLMPGLAIPKGEWSMKKFRKNEKGFTLIELLIVVAIIGILAAIAIPQFSAYRAKAYNAAANTDLRNLRSHLEAYFYENQYYP